MRHDWKFEQQVMDEARDEDYRADMKAERETIRELCPNPSCFGGDVIVPDRSGLSALAVCGWCAGRGYVVTERQS